MVIKTTLDERSKNKEGRYPIKYRFSAHGKSIYISTGFFSSADEFDEVSGLFSLQNKKTREVHRRHNIILSGELERASRLLFDLEQKGQGNISAARFKDLFVKKTSEGITFDSHYKNFMSLIEKERTKGIYQNTYNKIKKMFRDELYFEDINFSFLQKFEQKLRQKGNAVNTISIDMRNIRAVFNDAARKKLVSKDLYPFDDYKIKNEETEHRAITVEQLRELFNFSGTDSENYARDVAKLIFFLIGINASDLYSLSAPVNGRIDYRRNKTGRLYSIKIEPEADVLLKQFKGENQFLCFQEQFSTEADFLKKINGVDIIKDEKRKFLKRGLNTIGDALGIENLTSYVLRHTWATIAGELDISKETIKKALGHGKKEVTDVYIKFNPAKVDKANREIIDHVFEIITQNTVENVQNPQR